jgi:hypothetical protein
MCSFVPFAPLFNLFLVADVKLYEIFCIEVRALSAYKSGLWW